MVFAEAEAYTIADELGARSSLRERKQKPQNIKLLDRDKEPAPLKTATTVNEEEDVRFDISLGEKSGEEGSNPASEVLEARGQWRNRNSYLC